MRLGRCRFTLRVDGGELVDVSRGEPRDPPDAIVDTDPDTLNAVIGDDRALAMATKDGRVTITGDVDAGRRLAVAVAVAVTVTDPPGPDRRPSRRR